jgi:hypothetical protein
MSKRVDGARSCSAALARRDRRGDTRFVALHFSERCRVVIDRLGAGTRELRQRAARE